MNEQLHVNDAECRDSCDIHRGERPYVCDVCKKAYSHKKSLITHQRIHSDECSYTCEVCNKIFSQQMSLITHQRIHTEIGRASCRERV